MEYIVPFISNKIVANCFLDKQGQSVGHNMQDLT